MVGFTAAFAATSQFIIPSFATALKNFPESHVFGVTMVLCGGCWQVVPCWTTWNVAGVGSPLTSAIVPSAVLGRQELAESCQVYEPPLGIVVVLVSSSTVVN